MTISSLLQDLGGEERKGWPGSQPSLHPSGLSRVEFWAKSLGRGFGRWSRSSGLEAGDPRQTRLLSKHKRCGGRLGTFNKPRPLKSSYPLHSSPTSGVQFSTQYLMERVRGHLHPEMVSGELLMTPEPFPQSYLKKGSVTHSLPSTAGLLPPPTPHIGGGAPARLNLTYCGCPKDFKNWVGLLPGAASDWPLEN